MCALHDLWPVDLGVNIMRQLTEQEKTELGKEWAHILMLKRSTDHRDRYLTTWGDKTAIGIYEVINRLVYQRFDAIEKRGANVDRGLITSNS